MWHHNACYKQSAGCQGMTAVNRLAGIGRIGIAVNWGVILYNLKQVPNNTL
jgi:hypothetical protein